MLLSGNQIKKEIEAGRIKVDPFDEEMIQPASLDLKLGPKIIEPLGRYPWRFTLVPDDPIELRKGCYLMHTEEKVGSEHYVGILSGKSSIGRQFVQIHSTAGYIDPGFQGQLTLEVIVHRTFTFCLGMPICQIHFHEITGDITLYDGKYQGDKAIGAVEAQ